MTRARQVTLTYALAAGAWILFSDNLLRLFLPDPEAFLRWSVYKGVAFVGLTSLLLLVVLGRAFGAAEAGYQALLAQDQELRRLNRLYSALSQINQAIVRSSSREELLESVCQALVRDGGFTMSWIGWEDPGSRRLEPAAAAGDQDGYVGRIVIYTDERPEGLGPAGRAFRADSPMVCNDIHHDPLTIGWREQAIRQGFCAFAAFPVHDKGRVRGVLSVYAAEPGFFQEPEIALLVEAARDLSHALDNLALRDERRRAELLARREREFSQTMIESMPGVLYLYDEQGRLLRWNRNFETVTGYSAAEIGQMRPLEFFAREDQAALEERIAEVFQHGESSIEAPFLSKDGTSKHYHFTGKRILFDGAACLVGVGIDISDRKRAEDALRELNDTLEARVVERTEALQQAVLRAEAADRIKSAFLATMSHELRTPLNSIIGFTGIILQGLAGPLNEEQARQLGMVRTSARHLLDLINDVLDLSKIEAGQLEVRVDVFDLREAIERVTALVRPMAERKGLEISSSVDPSLGEMKSDRRRFEQILLNLLNNAVKFTDRGGVTLTVERHAGFRRSVQEPIREAVKVRVIDTGIGIRPEDLQNLFQPFRQLDSGLTRQHEGSGLGLAICRRLCDLMGGTITATSQWGAGSEFSVTLPLQGLVDE